MAPTTPVTEKLCYACLYDTVRVMVDYKAPPDARRATGPAALVDGASVRDDAAAAATAAATVSDSKALGMEHRAATGAEVAARRARRARVPGQGEGRRIQEQCARGQQEQEQGERECDTGGWGLVHRGEVEVPMPAAVACKLIVEGRRARIHRTGTKELYDKLGFDGTVRRATLKLAGCSKVYSSRTEMLKELNTTGIPSNDALQRKRLEKLRRRNRPLSLPGDQGGEGGQEPADLPFMERQLQWEEKRRLKVAERLARKREKEEAEVEAARALLAPREAAERAFDGKTALSSRQTEALLERMQADSQKRADRIRDFDARIAEGMRKLQDRAGLAVGDGRAARLLSKRRGPRPRSAVLCSSRKA
jgi:hypothetical protein